MVDTWRKHRGSGAAGCRWRGESTSTPPTKWVGLGHLVLDGVATREAMSTDPAREVPQEHKSVDTAPAGPNSWRTMLHHVNGVKIAESHDVLGSSPDRLTGKKPVDRYRSRGEGGGGGKQPAAI